MSQLRAIAERLRRQLDADRTTVRVEPDRNYPIAAESLGPGVRSMASESSIDQGAATTVRWVREHRRVLSVDDARATTTPPPAAMLSEYELRAFMIAPLELGGGFAGTVSVHVNGRPRRWTDADRAVLRDAAAAAAAAIQAAETSTGAETSRHPRAVRDPTT